MLWDSSTAAPLVATGTQVVTSLWLERCLAEQTHVPEAEYLVQGSSQRYLLLHTHKVILQHC